MSDNNITEKDLEPPKYKEVGITLSETENFNTGPGTLNGLILDYEFKTSSIMDIKYPHDKIITLKDLNQGNENQFITLIKGDFNGNLYIAGLKPIIFEHTQPYIEPEKTNHSDFVFMVLLPFLALMLVLRLRKRIKKK
jgi:hypothetical protein